MTPTTIATMTTEVRIPAIEQPIEARPRRRAAFGSDTAVELATTGNEHKHTCCLAKLCRVAVLVTFQHNIFDFLI